MATITNKLTVSTVAVNLFRMGGHECIWFTFAEICHRLSGHSVDEVRTVLHGMVASGDLMRVPSDGEDGHRYTLATHPLNACHVGE